MGVTFLVDTKHPEPILPEAGEKVRVKGREGVFLVVRVDRNSNVADLVRCGPGAQMVNSSVPVELLLPAIDYLPELFRWYVETAASR